ncbi:MAG: HigA family addiction module antitoxin [Elusimicrobiota bacterium]
MIPKNRIPVHPGEILLREFIEPLGISQIAIARKMEVSVQRINTLINGKRDMTAETALFLSKALNTTPEFWMNLQVARDLYLAEKQLKAA